MIKKKAVRTDTSKTVKKQSLPNYFLLPCLLIIYLLIKVGTFPLLLFKSLSSILVTAKKIFYHIPIIHLPKVHIPLPSFPKKLILPLLVLIFFGYSFLLLRLSFELPSPSGLTPLQRSLTTHIYDREGRLLYQIYEGRNRSLIKISDLPKHLIQATIATEDKNFFKHHGIDLKGILRAVKYNLTREDTSTDFVKDGWQGGSTITQQLIKNTLLTPDKTFQRKFKEALLAVWVESLYSKEEILQMYFNEVPYGGPAWGIQAAARMYFGKETSDLNLAESSFLAGLPAAPSVYSPYGSYPEEGKKRQQEVLRRMVTEGFIDKKEADDAYNLKLEFRPKTIAIKAPHFVMYIRSLLAERYGEKAVSQGGLKVVTTLDLELQEMAERVVFEEVDKLKNLQVGNGAALITDPKTGQILAMVGSKDYFDPKEGNFNTTLSPRPPGSSIKPVTYAAAFKEGFTPGTLLLDAPTTFPNPWGIPYTPVNYDGRFHGPVTVRTALGSSYNIPAVKILAMIGLPKMIQTASEMGITTFTDSSNFGLSLTLGGGGVKMLDMMTVYGSLANNGIKHQPLAILSVTDSNGEVLEENYAPRGRTVLTPEIAYLVNHILSDSKARIPAFGTNSLLEIQGHPSVAVKTGTSDDKRDNWAFGYTPEVVVGAWVGNNDNKPMHPTLSSGITGATPIWHRIMVILLQEKPDLVFIRPSGIIETRIDGKRDLGLVGQIPKTILFSKKVEEKEREKANRRLENTIREGNIEEKEIISYSDQFSTFTPELKTIQ